ncbi:MAG: MarP family serine protease [Thermoleophilaceae bacterium]|nr:MarP family serine protease [Thermoleophilaceae bacterium]
MTTLDIVIIGFVAALAVWGFRQGAVIGVSSLAGFVGGTLLGTRLAGAVLTQGSQSPYTPIFGLIGGLVIGIAVSELTLSVGFQFRQRFTSRTAHRIDGSLGAVLLGAFALGIIWIGAAAVSQSRLSEQIQQTVRKSTVVRKLNATLPSSGGLLNALARVDPFPVISGPSADVSAPDPVVAGDPDIAAVSDSVVRVVGTACGYGIEGSGWVASTNLVVTNAHVVAGQVDTQVQVPNGATFNAPVVWFDPTNDLALLAVPGLGLAPIPYQEGDAEGVSGAVLGYPENGPFDVQPARVGKTANVLSRDIYDAGPIQRQMTAFRANVRHGNSGGPFVDENGVVRATVFAKSLDHDGEGYGVPISQLTSALTQANSTVTVSTGPCT